MSIAYQSALRPLSHVVEAVPAEAWGNTSPCAEWTARDVVVHLIDTQRSLLTERGYDPGPAPDLTDPATGLREHTASVLGLISSDAVADSAYEGFFGPTTVGATLQQFYVWDMLVHRWDIARSTGGDDRFAPEELDVIEAGADSFGSMLHMDGICGPAVPAPAAADRQTLVLARLGRTTS